MKKYKFIILQIITTILFSCSNQTADNKEEVVSLNNYLNKGWQSFSNKDFNLSLSYFKKASALNSDTTDVYNGIVWSYIKLNIPDSATKYYSIGLLKKGNKKELYIANVFLLHVKNSYNLTITHLYNLIYDSSGLVTWSFANNLNLNQKHLYLIEAQTYFALNTFTLSLSAIKKIDSTINIDISTINGKELLAQKIEQLFKNI